MGKSDNDVSAFKAELLEAGSVVHFRKRLAVRIQVLEAAKILRIGLAPNVN